MIFKARASVLIDPEEISREGTKSAEHCRVAELTLAKLEIVLVNLRCIVVKSIYFRLGVFGSLRMGKYFIVIFGKGD